MAQDPPVLDLTDDQAALELQRLHLDLSQANQDYQRDDSQSLDAASSDPHKRRTAQTSQSYPHL